MRVTQREHLWRQIEERLRELAGVSAAAGEVEGSADMWQWVCLARRQANTPDAAGEALADTMSAPPSKMTEVCVKGGSMGQEPSVAVS